MRFWRMTPPRAALIAVALLLLPGLAAAPLAGQQLAILHINVAIVGPDGRPEPVPRHALLISDNPATAAPRRTVTDADGKAEVHVRPGNYTVESDEPLVLGGKSYAWRQTLDLAAGQEASLDLTSANAIISDATPAAGTPTPGQDRATAAPSAILMQWQDSVVSIWTPTGHGAGVLVDARGLVVTNQRLIGDATDVQVQLSPSRKFGAAILASDPARNVAVLWIDAGALAAEHPATLAAQGAPLEEDQEVFAIATPMRDRKRLESGSIARIERYAVVADLHLDADSSGTPLFGADGTVIGVTSIGSDAPESSDAPTRAVGVAEVRVAMAAAERRMKTVPPPSAVPLPVEPLAPFPEEALKAASATRAGSRSAYEIATSDFDVSVITPVLLYAAQHAGEELEARGHGRPGRNTGAMQIALRATGDFANWTDYVDDLPAVVMLRVTPKMGESFWAMVGRNAARTQGVELPAFTRPKAAFAALRLYCGDREVTPIHPFRIENRVDAANVVEEGLYVFEPDAIGPSCGTVKVAVYSTKAPEKPDVRLVPPAILEQLRADFAPYRRR